MADIIQIRRDTSDNWTSVNPILAQGEIGLETDTRLTKAGNGITAWNSLSYTDAYTVNGFNASDTATAGKLLALNSGSKLPASITGDAASVIGKVPTAAPTVNSIPMSDSNGFLSYNWFNALVKSYNYNWDYDLTIPNGRCLSITLPPSKEITILDGYSLTVNDGGDFILFSL